MIKANEIKPKVRGESDKYSWNLYKFINKVRYCNKVIVDIESWQRDEGEPFDIRRIKECGYLKRQHVFIVREGYFQSGKKLASILSGVPPLHQTFYYGWLQNDRILDITEVFWDEYKRRGRCLFFAHEEHFIKGIESRYIQINKHSRKCRWCGHIQTRSIKTIKTIKRVEEWK